MSAESPTAPGLRERTKTRRRRLILRTALRLFAENGYDRTTIQDIAAAAEVAPRTVTGYFPSKLDLVTEWPAVRTRRIAALYAEHPGIEFTELVDLWWTDARERVDTEEAALTRAMAAANPGVAAMAEAEVARAVADSGVTLPGSSTDPADLVQAAGRAALQGINETFFRGLAEGRMTDEVQSQLAALVRTIVTATHAGHGALAPHT